MIRWKRVKLVSILQMVCLPAILFCSCVEDFSIDMVYLPGGEYLMGVDGGGDADETPAHMVKVAPFYMGRYEVTQREWRKVMGRNPSFFRGSNRPVENVSWNDAKRFIAHLNNLTGENYRLPTEQEWEWAASAGGSVEGAFSGGEPVDSVAWSLSNSKEHTWRVGRLRPNKFGIYDLTGNVSEWCSTDYDSLAYAKRAGVLDSLYPSITDEVVARGGNWASDPYYLRIHNRNHAPTNYKSPTVGLRLVLDVDKSLPIDESIFLK